MTERTCVVCRRRRAPSELLALHRGDDGRLVLGRSLRGRGSWICAERQCFDRFAATRFGRGLSADALREEARNALSDELGLAFESARRAGVLVSGRSAVAAAIARGEVRFVAFANDAGGVARARVPVAELEIATVPWSSSELGRRLGKGPRSVLAARSSRLAQALLARLRRWENVG